MIITCRHAKASPDTAVAAEVSTLLERRAAMANPPSSLVISDATAVSIAALFASPTPSGQVLERFYRTGSIDSDQLIEAARTEQGYSSPEGHAALYCLIMWARSKQATRVRA